MMDVIYDARAVAEMFDRMTGGQARQFNRRVLRSCASVMVARTRARFKKQEGPDGQVWAPLSALSIRARMEGLGKSTKRSRGGGFAGGHKALQDTGALMKSIVPRFTSDSEAAVEANAPYAAIHQKGATWQRTQRQCWWMILNLMRPFGDIESAPIGLQSFLWMRMRKMMWSMMKKPGRIPARPFMGINAADAAEMVKMVDWWVIKTFQGQNPSPAVGQEQG
jgi:phage virion morphogenesis protein